jgi:hypothetical protein
MTHLNTGKRMLITTDGWFYAPDGRQYRAVWGTPKVYKDEETLGIKTNIRSTNWYIFVGSGEKGMIVAGCQIKYAIVCDAKPNDKGYDELRWHEASGASAQNRVDNGIYIAE